MSDADDLLPLWARHHEPAFSALLRALERVPGFILQPLETPGRDLDRVLAAWLSTHGHPTHVVAPDDAEAWRGLAASLRSAPAGPNRIVLVSGPSTVDPDVFHGLAMVNLHRDGIARGLACPLLWCGTPMFLHATWDMAPDFWSIASIVRYFPAQPVELAVPPMRLESTEDDVDFDALTKLYAAAREQGDRDNMVVLGTRLIGAMLANGQISMATAMAEQVTSLSPFRIEPDDALRLMRYLERLGQPADQLRSHYHTLIEQMHAYGPRHAEAQALLQLAVVEHSSGQKPVAREALRQASELFAGLGDAQSEAAALLQLAQVELDDGDGTSVVASLERADEALRRAPTPELRTGLLLLRARLQYLEERFSDALATIADAEVVTPGRQDLAAAAAHLRGGILARIGEGSKARLSLVRAMELYEAQGNADALAGVHRMLAALAVGEGDSETATRHFKAAAQGFDDPRKAVERDLGLALIAEGRGDDRQAAVLAWNAYMRSVAQNPAVAPNFHATMLQLVRRALAVLPDEAACAAVDRLLGERSDEVSLPAYVDSDTDVADRHIVEHAVVRLR